MDNYIVSARKYRPSTFRSVIGQSALTTTLKNAIASNKLAHAYLFCGPRGVGKTTCARIFAKTINCLNPTPEHESCNECESCVAFNEQRSYNIHELDAASNNSVDDIRSLIDQVRIPPQIGKYKVYIIDEVHMLSQAAFNSFLKTLEEPPAHAIFILATTEKHKIIPTILSRCQVYDFNRIGIPDIVEHLQYVAREEKVSTEAEALNVIAQKADGGMRDALSIFDQTVSFTGGNITYKAVIENLNVLDYEYYFKLTDAILAGSVVDCLMVLDDILNRGFEGQYIIGGIAAHFRDLLVCKDAMTAQLFQVGASIRQRYIETAKRCANDFLYKSIDLANDCDLNYRQSKNKRLLMELTLIRLCQLSEGKPSAQVAAETPKNEIKPLASAPKEEQPAPQPQASPTATPQKEEETPKPQAQAVETQEAQNRVEEPKTESATLPESSLSLKRKTVSISGMGVSISGINNKTEEETTQAPTLPEEPKPSASNLFTEKELVSAWVGYANQLGEEKLLRNTMNLYHPKMLGDTLFEVEVNTEINRQYIDNKSLSILSFLRNILRNDDITMTIRIAEGNAIKKSLTSREIFDEMVKQNPALQKLSDEFGLELS
jgi:DNA polymerase-3 subunit gamma/tau